MTENQPKQKPVMVVVDWEDPKNSAVWTKPDAKFEAAPCRTVGWLVSHTDEYVTICHTIGDYIDGTEEAGCDIALLGCLCLPAGCVKRIKEVAEYEQCVAEDLPQATTGCPVEAEKPHGVQPWPGPYRSDV